MNHPHFIASNSVFTAQSRSSDKDSMWYSAGSIRGEMNRSVGPHNGQGHLGKWYLSLTTTNAATAPAGCRSSYVNMDTKWAVKPYARDYTATGRKPGIQVLCSTCYRFDAQAALRPEFATRLTAPPTQANWVWGSDTTYLPLASGAWATTALLRVGAPSRLWAGRCGPIEPEPWLLRPGSGRCWPSGPLQARL